MFTALSIFYELTMTTYTGIETLVENDMAKKERDYTEEEFLRIMQERASEKQPRA